MTPPHSWEAIKLAVGSVLLILLAFAVAYRFVSPAPPDRIRLASGQPDGAYALFAERYRAEPALNGIEVEVVSSTGSLDNLALLAAGHVDVALVQAGVAANAADIQTDRLQSLGSILHEPLWIFTRAGQEFELLSDLAGARLELGPEGSGTRALATRLLEANGIEYSNAATDRALPSSARDALVGGDVDALFAVAGVQSPAIRSLFDEPAVSLFEVVRAEAYTRLDRSLSAIVLPRGVIDLRRDIPAKDTTLIATVAEIVIGPDFHPALVDILLQAANRIHGRGDVLSPPGRFPSPRWVDLPLSPDADRYFEYGPPFLQRYLPLLGRHADRPAQGHADSPDRAFAAPDPDLSPDLSMARALPNLPLVPGTPGRQSERDRGAWLGRSARAARRGRADRGRSGQGSDSDLLRGGVLQPTSSYRIRQAADRKSDYDGKRLLGEETKRRSEGSVDS